MPDPENTSTDSLQSDADRAAIREMEAELERELAAIRVKQLPATALEIRLKNLRTSIASLESTNSPSPASDMQAATAPSLVTGAPTGNGANPVSELLNWISLNLTAVERAAAIFSDYEQLQTELAQAANPALATGASNQPGPQPTPQGELPVGIAAAPAQLFEVPPIEGPNFRNNAQSQNAATSSDTGSNPRTPEDFARVIAAQNQTFQNSGELLSAALERNSFMANSIFTQMLHIIDSQNQRFGDLDRKISDINSRIKSLKNP